MEHHWYIQTEEMSIRQSVEFLRGRRSNQSLQLTAGRSDASHKIMNTHLFQSALAPASGS